MFDVIIDNRSMNDAGLKVASRPLVLSPEKKYQTRTALNRDGALYRDMGTFEDVEISVDFNFMTNERRWNEFFRWAKTQIWNAKELMFSDDQHVFRKVKKAAIISVKRPTPQIGMVTAVFTVDPHSYLVPGKHIFRDPEDYSFNQWDECCPIYCVKGAGVLAVNGFQMRFDAGEMLYIDTDREITYNRAKQNRNAAVSGNYKDLRLNPGMNEVTLTGGILRVIPNWRFL